MSVCPHCGRHTTSSQSPCPHCQESRESIASEHTAQGSQVIEPEIVSSAQEIKQEAGQSFEQDFGKGAQQGNHIRFITWQSGQGGCGGRRGQCGQGGQNGQGNNRTFSAASGMQGFTSQGFTSSANTDACLPGIITLVWAIVLGVQFGILASIGFLVFYGIGTAFSLAITVRRAMQGQYTPAWLRRSLVWLISAGITVGLADGF